MKYLCKFIVSVFAGLCAAGVAAQTNPLGILQQIQKTIEQNQVNNTAVPQAPSPAPISPTAPQKQQAPANASANATTIMPSPEWCEKIANNETLRQIANTLKKAKKSGKFRDDDFRFLDSEGLATKWIRDRVENCGDGSKFQCQDRVKYTLGECAYNLMKDDTDNIFIYSSREIKLDYSRGDFDQRVKSEQPIKSIDDSGNIVMKAPDKISRSNPFSLGNGEYPLAAALFFPNGANMLKNIGDEFSKRAELKFEELSNKEKLAKVESEKAAQAKVAEEEAAKRRYAEYKSGNYKSLTNCTDLAVAFAVDSGLIQDLKPALNPTGAIFAGRVRLDKYQENNSSGSGFIKEAGQFASVKTGPKTAWIDKSNIKINEHVCVAGKYTGNTAVTLSSGVGQQVMVLELLCVQSDQTCANAALGTLLKR